MPRGRKKKSEMLSNDAGYDNGMGPIDAHVGARICARRRLLQMSQKDMAEALGVTFQQIQKYEKGVNRIGAGRLFNIAQLLGVDIDYFYDDVSPDSYSAVPAYKKVYSVGFLQEEQVEQKSDPIDGTESTMLLKAYYALPSKARSALLIMLTNLRNKEDTNADA